MQTLADTLTDVDEDARGHPGSAAVDVPALPAARPSARSRFKALADLTRVAIVNRLAQARDVRLRSDRSVRLSQPTISHHLKVLVRRLSITRRGTWAYYA